MQGNSHACKGTGGAFALANGASSQHPRLGAARMPAQEGKPEEAEPGSGRPETQKRKEERKSRAQSDVAGREERSFGWWRLPLDERLEVVRLPSPARPAWPAWADLTAARNRPCRRRSLERGLRRAAGWPSELWMLRPDRRVGLGAPEEPARALGWVVERRWQGRRAVVATLKTLKRRWAARSWENCRSGRAQVRWGASLRRQRSSSRRAEWQRREPAAGRRRHRRESGPGHPSSPGCQREIEPCRHRRRRCRR